MSEPRKSRREPKLSQRFKDFIGEETSCTKSTPAKSLKNVPKATPAKTVVKPTPRKVPVKTTPKEVKQTPKTGGRGRPPKKAVEEEESEEEEDEESEEEELVKTAKPAAKREVKQTPKAAGRGRPPKKAAPVESEEEEEESEEEELLKASASASKATAKKDIPKSAPRGRPPKKVAPPVEEDEEDDEDEEEEGEQKPAANKNSTAKTSKKPTEPITPVIPEGRTKRIIKVTAKVAEAQELSSLFRNSNNDSAKKVVAATKVTIATPLNKIKRLDPQAKGKGGAILKGKGKPGVKGKASAEHMEEEEDDDESGSEEEDMDVDEEEEDHKKTIKTKPSGSKIVTVTKTVLNEEKIDKKEMDDETEMPASDKVKVEPLSPAKVKLNSTSSAKVKVESASPAKSVKESSDATEASPVKVKTEADSSTDSPSKASVKRVNSSVDSENPNAKKIKLTPSSPVSHKSSSASCANDKMEVDPEKIKSSPVKLEQNNSSPVKTSIIKSSPIKTTSVKTSSIKTATVKSPVKMNSGSNRFDPYGRSMTPETKKVVNKVLNKKKGIADELASRMGALKDSSDDMSDAADESMESKGKVNVNVSGVKGKLPESAAKTIVKKTAVPKAVHAGSGSDSDARRSRRQPKITEKMKEFLHKSSDEENVDEPAAMTTDQDEDEDELTESDDDGGNSFLQLMKGSSGTPSKPAASATHKTTVTKTAAKPGPTSASKAKITAPIIKTRPISQVIKTKPVIAKQIVKGASKNVLLSSSAGSKVTGKPGALKLGNSNVKVNTKVVTTKQVNGNAHHSTLSSSKRLERPFVIKINTRDPEEVEEKKKIAEEKKKEVGEHKVIKIFTRLNLSKDWANDSLDDEDMDSDDYTDSDEELSGNMSKKKVNGNGKSNDWEKKNADIIKLCGNVITSLKDICKTFTTYEKNRNVLNKAKFTRFTSLCEKLATTMSKVVKEEKRKFSNAMHFEEYVQDLLDMIAVKSDPTKDDCLSVQDAGILTSWLSEKILAKSMESEHIMLLSQLLELLSNNADIKERMLPKGDRDDEEMEEEDEDMDDEEDDMLEEEEEEDMEDDMEDMEDEDDLGEEEDEEGAEDGEGEGGNEQKS